jgi:hypothetical protein
LIEDTLLIAIAATAPLAVVGAVLAIRYWRVAVLSVFVLLVVEGALRKWFFPWAETQIYFVKDIILLGAYLGFLLDSRKHRLRITGTGLIKGVCGLVFVFGCMELFNPNSPSIFMGVIGLKAYFVYVPLGFILPYVFESREGLFRCLRLYLMMAIPVAALGFVQVALGPDSFVNTYVSHTDDGPQLAYFGENLDIVRTSGTFSYISGYTTYLGFIAFLAIGFNMAGRWQIRKNVVPVLSLVLCIGAMFTTGSRTPVYSLMISAPFIWYLAWNRGLVNARIAIRLAVVLPIIGLAALNLSPEAVDAFAYRSSHSDEASSRMMMPVLETIDAIENAPIFGLGIGVTHNSAMRIMGADSPWWLSGLLFESEPPRIVVEMGIFGFILQYIIRVLVVAVAIGSVMSFKDKASRALGIVLLPHLALGIWVPLVNNVAAGMYYWGAFGLVLAMRRLEQRAHTEASGHRQLSFELSGKPALGRRVQY